MRFSPRRQGDLGEYSAIEWLGRKGYDVFFPLGHSRWVDLVAQAPGGALLRVQVKTGTYAVANGRFEVAICTRGGNRSWNGLVKRFSRETCDFLFVHVADGRRFFIPADAVEGSSVIVVGGPKYAAYEIEPGHPLDLAEAG